MVLIFMKKIVSVVIAAAVISAMLPISVLADEEHELSAHSAIVMCADTGDVIFEKNADERMLIASITKIMTRTAVLVPITPLSMKKSGTLMSAPLPKQTICRFVRLKKTFVLTAERSFGTGIYAMKSPP